MSSKFESESIMMLLCAASADGKEDKLDVTGIHNIFGRNKIHLYTGISKGMTFSMHIRHIFGSLLNCRVWDLKYGGIR